MFIHQMAPAARHPPAIVGPDTKLCEVARLLSKEHINLVVVCEPDGRMVGVINDSDVVRTIANCGGLRSGCQTDAQGVMTTNVVSCGSEDNLRDVWERMKAHRLRHLPAIDGHGKPAVVVNARDVLRWLFEEAEYEERELRDYFLSLGFH